MMHLAIHLLNLQFWEESDSNLECNQSKGSEFCAIKTNNTTFSQQHKPYSV